MKTKLLIMAFLIGCGEEEQVTTTVATPTATTKEVETVDNENTTKDATTKTDMVEVKNEVTEENIETVITNDNTTNVEGENND